MSEDLISQLRAYPAHYTAAHEAAYEIEWLRHDIERAIDGRNKEAKARISAEKKVGSLRTALKIIDASASCDCRLVARAALKAREKKDD